LMMKITKKNCLVSLKKSKSALLVKVVKS